MEGIGLTFLVIGLICVAIATGLLLKSYAKPNTPLLVLITTYIAYLFCFAPVILLITDQLTDDESHLLTALWGVSYWTAFIGTWFAFPLADKYYESGAFTTKQKLLFSVRANLWTYLAMAVLAIIFILFVLFAGTVEFSDLDGFLVVCANTVGMLMAVLLLGYGLVEIPRLLWYRGNRVVQLKNCLFQLTSLNADVMAAQENLYQTRHFLKGFQAKVQDHSALRPLIPIVMAALPDASKYSTESVSVRHLEPIELLDTLRNKSKQDLTENDLSALHSHVIMLERQCFVAHAQWRETVEFALELERLLAEERSNHANKSYLKQARVKHEAKVWRFLSVVTGLVSLLILWGECVVWTSTDVTLFGLLFTTDPVVVSIFGGLLFVYFLGCGYYGIFEMRLMSLYCMHARGRTDPNSLLLSASFLMRIFAPLTFNFAKVYRLDMASFTSVVGSMSVFPVFGQSFNEFFPILIAVFAVMNLANVFGKLLNCLGVRHFQRDEAFEDDAIAEGKLLLRKEKNLLGSRSDVDEKSTESLSFI